MIDKPFFSVVIPTLNEEKYLPNLLTDLSRQTFTNLEVLVVDGHSEDATINTIKKFTNQLEVNVHQVDKRNVSFQRNFGAQHAQGEWVIFMDADTRIPKHFLEGIKYQLIKAPEVSLFSTLLTTDEEQPMDRAIETVMNLGLKLYNSINKPSAMGALLGAKRNLLHNVKFDETNKVLEDSFFVKAAIEAGYTFQVFSEPRYTYSLRRMKKEGTLKLLASTAKMQLRLLAGENVKNDDMGYTMSGGAYYEKAKPSIFDEIQEYLEKASKNQIDQAKKLLEKITG